MAGIEPYKIAIPQEKLDRLKQKLALTDFPDELDEAAWDYGSPLADIKRLVARWQDSYDWRAAEKELNLMPQFTAKIPVSGFETLDIHFVHQTSQVTNAIPLVFVHGWPGSFDEVRKILPELVQGTTSTPAFHVVAPSLPNFGFSSGTRKRGFGGRQQAEVCHKLMLLLGYDQYVTQGGDIGYAVTRAMGLFYPESCRASHVNMPVPSHPHLPTHPDLFFKAQQTPLSSSEKAGIARTQWFTKDGSGYNILQRTKPQTIGYSMTDSPVGLLAWIYEKLHDWTDNYQWTDDEILTWVSIYWFSTAGPHASQRIYYERGHDPENLREKCNGYIPNVKLGCARFPKELFHSPLLWNETLGPLVLNSEYDHGGHFAAWERPDAIIKDLREMFGKQGGAYAVVHGKTGYDE